MAKRKNVQMRGLGPGSTRPGLWPQEALGWMGGSNSRPFKNPAKAQATVCTLCNVQLNSEFQSREHFSGKTHKSKQGLLGHTAEKTASDFGQFAMPAGSAKRVAADSKFIPSSKKPKLSATSTPSQGKSHLTLLREYKHGLQINVSGQMGTQRPPFTASLDLDGKSYSATGSSKHNAQQALAEVIFNQIGSQIEQTLAQRTAQKLERQNFGLKSTPKSVEAVCKQTDEDFTSNDNICNILSFNLFDVNESTTKPDAKNTKSEALVAEADAMTSMLDSDGKATAANTVEPECSDTTSGGTFPPGTLSTALDGTASAEQVVAKQKHKTSVVILKLLRPGATWETKTSIPTGYSADQCVKEFVVSMNVDGESFEGRSTLKHLARAYAAEAALVKLFGLEFYRNEDGMSLFKGDTSKISLLKKREIPITEDSLEIDGKNPILLLNELFPGQVAFSFLDPTKSEWGLEHHCTVSVGGMTIKGQDSSKKNAKKRAAVAAIAALKASGMYDRKIAENIARRTGVPVRQAMQRLHSVTCKQIPSNPVTKNVKSLSKSVPPSSQPKSATVRLNTLFPGSKYKFLGETVDKKGYPVNTVAVEVGEQTFQGSGRHLKVARMEAAEKALQTLGFWTSEDEKTKKQLQSARKAKTLAANAVNRSKRGAFGSWSYPRNVGYQSSLLTSTARGRATNRNRLISGWNRGKQSVPALGGDYTTPGNRGRGSRIRFVGQNSRGSTRTDDNISSKLLTLSNTIYDVPGNSQFYNTPSQQFSGNPTYYTDHSLYFEGDHRPIHFEHGSTTAGVDQVNSQSYGVGSSSYGTTSNQQSTSISYMKHLKGDSGVISWRQKIRSNSDWSDRSYTQGTAVPGGGFSQSYLPSAEYDGAATYNDNSWLDNAY